MTTTTTDETTATVAIDFFASESKVDIIATLQEYLLDEDWTSRINNHFLIAVEAISSKTEEEDEDEDEEEKENTHSLFTYYQQYEQLFEERLNDFCCDHTEFGINEHELYATLSKYKKNPLLQRLIQWTTFKHYKNKIIQMKNDLRAGEEAARLMGL
jgi:hypothetical protein